MEETTTTKIPMLPARGEVWFSLNLNLISEQELLALKELLQKFPSLQPRPAYKFMPDTGIEPHLLLFHEKREELRGTSGLFQEETEALANLIDPDAIELISCNTPVAA